MIFDLLTNDVRQDPTRHILEMLWNLEELHRDLIHEVQQFAEAQRTEALEPF